MSAPTKVLFLDIDGVLNSQRTCEAFGGPATGGYPHGFDAPNMALFDRASGFAKGPWSGSTRRLRFRL